MFKKINPVLLPSSCFMISALCKFLAAFVQCLNKSILPYCQSPDSWYRPCVHLSGFHPVFKNYCQPPLHDIGPLYVQQHPSAVQWREWNQIYFKLPNLVSKLATPPRELLFETKLVIAISTVGTGKRNWWWGSHQDQKTSKTNNQTWACLSDTIVSSNITLLYCLNSALSGELIRLVVKVGKAQHCFNPWKGVQFSQIEPPFHGIES